MDWRSTIFSFLFPPLFVLLLLLVSLYDGVFRDVLLRVLVAFMGCVDGAVILFRTFGCSRRFGWSLMGNDL